MEKQPDRTDGNEESTTNESSWAEAYAELERVTTRSTINEDEWETTFDEFFAWYEGEADE